VIVYGSHSSASVGSMQPLNPKPAKTRQVHCGFVAEYPLGDRRSVARGLDLRVIHLSTHRAVGCAQERTGVSNMRCGGLQSAMGAEQVACLYANRIPCIFLFRPNPGRQASRRNEFFQFYARQSVCGRLRGLPDAVHASWESSSVEVASALLCQIGFPGCRMGLSYSNDPAPFVAWRPRLPPSRSTRSNSEARRHDFATDIV